MMTVLIVKTQKFYDAHSAILDDLKDANDELRKMKKKPVVLS
jgi:hypothetical protein